MADFQSSSIIDQTLRRSVCGLSQVWSLIIAAV